MDVTLDDLRVVAACVVHLHTAAMQHGVTAVSDNTSSSVDASTRHIHTDCWEGQLSVQLSGPHQKIVHTAVYWLLQQERERERERERDRQTQRTCEREETKQELRTRARVVVHSKTWKEEGRKVLLIIVRLLSRFGPSAAA